MNLWIPTPRDVLGAARTTVGWAVDTTVLVVSLPVRVTRALAETELLLDAMARLTEDADRAVRQVNRVLIGAERSVAAAESTVVGAARVIEGAESTVRGAGRVITGAEGTVAGAERVIEGAESTVRGAGRVIAGAEGTVAGAARVIEGAESTVAGAARVIEGAESTVAGAARVITGAEGTVGGARAVTADAEQLLRAAAQLTAVAERLLELYRPIAEQAAPLAGKFVAEFSEEELRAAIDFIEQLPELSKYLSDDVMPLLATLDRAGPDIHELLDVAKDVREAVVGIPGFAFFRKRGEHKLES